MASELRVNTLKDAAGNNSIATSVVASGSAKMWVNFDGTASGAAARGSYNVSSMTDEGTGRYEVNINNNMSDANYGLSTAGIENGTTGTNIYISNNQAPTSSVIEVEYTKPGTGPADVAYNYVTAHGDLA